MVFERELKFQTVRVMLIRLRKSTHFLVTFFAFRTIVATYYAMMNELRHRFRYFRWGWFSIAVETTNQSSELRGLHKFHILNVKYPFWSDEDDDEEEEECVRL